MSLTPGEADHLLLFTQASLAQARRDRGLRLNAPEATALIAHSVCEWARDGLTLATVRAMARSVLHAEDVLPEVPSIVTEVRVEARFDDGTRLVVVPNPFGLDSPSPTTLPAPEATSRITITNTSGTAIGLTSHLHLAEANPRLRFDRAAAFGMRLALPTGDTLWLEPGVTTDIGISPLRGDRVVIGNTGVVDGPLDDPLVRDRALQRLRDCGYLDIHDGAEVNETNRVEEAVARLMSDRRDA